MEEIGAVRRSTLVTTHDPPARCAVAALICAYKLDTYIYMTVVSSLMSPNIYMQFNICCVGVVLQVSKDDGPSVTGKAGDAEVKRQVTGNIKALLLACLRWCDDNVKGVESRIIAAQTPTYKWDAASILTTKSVEDGLAWAVSQARGEIWAQFIGNISNFLDGAVLQACGMDVSFTMPKLMVEKPTVREQDEIATQHADLNFIMIRLRVMRLYEWLRSYQRQCVSHLGPVDPNCQLIARFRIDMENAEEMEASAYAFVKKTMFPRSLKHKLCMQHLYEMLKDSVPNHVSAMYTEDSESHRTLM